MVFGVFRGIHEDLRIYTNLSEDQWQSSWNPDDRPVIWGQSGLPI